MIVLGINDGHGASAALLRDGALIAACEEERLSRLKNHSGFPKLAIAEVLDLAGVDAAEIDLVAVAGRYAASGIVPEGTFSRTNVLAHYRKAGARRDGLIAVKDKLHRVGPIRAVRRHRQSTARGQAFGARFPMAQVQLIEHHECHAAAAYFGWGATDTPTLVLTADGDGDDLSATVSVAQGRQIDRIAGIDRRDSLGGMYEAVTFLLGMQPQEHEYKVMGLAPYAGDAPAVRHLADRLWDLVEFPSDGLGWRRRPGVPPFNRCTRFLGKLFRHERFDHIAGATQSFTERLLVEWVERCIRATGVTRVAVSGGVFMNVKANWRILNLPDVSDFFVCPSCGDSSNAIGAAFARCAAESNSRWPQPLGHLYLGREFSNADVEEALRGWTSSSGDAIDVRWPDDPELMVAELLAQGHVVARAKGRMEFGARALGNRSLLADASRRDCARVLNQAIKARDFWMPFAPATPVEDASKYVEKPSGTHFVSPYMMVAFPTYDTTRPLFQSALHPADWTARLQEVPEGWAPDFHGLLRHFERLRGHSIILNTSFNMHGEPIVRSPSDALAVFGASGLRYMQLGDAIISKLDP